MERVLVTGASGFIAWHLARALLERNIQVVGLTRATSDTTHISGLDVELRIGALEDPSSLASAVAECDTVFHLAGLTKALRLSELIRVNAQGTANLARVCAAEPHPPTVVYLSSLAAAGPTIGGKGRSEDDRPAPVSDYGRSKLAGEDVLREHAEQLPISVVRPPIVFGEADPGTLAIFKVLDRTRVHAIPGYVPRQYSLIYAGDLAEACVRVAEQGERLAPEFAAGQGIYFVESARRLTYGQLGHCLGRALGHKLTIPLPLPHAAVRLLGALADIRARRRGKSDYFSADKAREATAGAWICSADKIATTLGFDLPAELGHKLTRTANWYREQGWL